MDPHGMAGKAGRGTVRRGHEWQGRLGTERLDMEWRGGTVLAKRGWDCSGWAWQAWLGTAGPDGARCGMAGEARRGAAGLGVARQAKSTEYGYIRQ